MLNTSVRLSWWSTSRQIIEEEERVWFEVAEDENHCSTCASRIRHVKWKISKNLVDALFEVRRTKYWRTTFVWVKKEEWKDPIILLKEKLELPILS